MIRPWPPHYVRLPRHPRIWREQRDAGRRQYEKAKEDRSEAVVAGPTDVD